ncbi:MAG: hypothetical protein ABH824_06920 [Nanoarchaeota archaeon]|nr:hypothetical protein [Nanoarchaeota archaeon]MBU1631963.1 hypothetical protein [Nanoarchaeota archaeon]MBU1876420.1 hypothetical protein [Nanoarchaeota archaeon]
MYQTSHYSSCTSFSNVGYNRLESITQSSVSQADTFYSAVDRFSQSYDSGMFIPDIASSFQYQSEGQKAGYSYNSNQNPNYNLFQIQPEYNFIPDNFLKPGRSGTFVGNTEDIKEYVEEAFQRIFEKSLPNDIKISVLDEKEFRKIAPSLNTIGLSINRSELGLLSEIFILHDSIGKVMLTIGHELGHILSPSLPNTHDEEAKAYAFSLIWMNCIKEHNIAGLGDALIIDNPAENGLHNIAFRFVLNLVKQGKDLWDIYLGLMRKMISVVMME